MITTKTCEYCKGPWHTLPINGCLGTSCSTTEEQDFWGEIFRDLAAEEQSRQRPKTPIGGARVTTIASSATPVINTDTCDIFDITALAVDVTSMTTNLIGTPSNGQTLLIRIRDNGTPRRITWGTRFRSSMNYLPAMTVATKTHIVGLVYDTAKGIWLCIIAPYPLGY